MQIDAKLKTALDESRLLMACNIGSDSLLMQFWKRLAL
jgi:hypothetical protein